MRWYAWQYIADEEIGKLMTIILIGTELWDVSIAKIAVSVAVLPTGTLQLRCAMVGAESQFGRADIYGWWREEG